MFTPSLQGILQGRDVVYRVSTILSFLHEPSNLCGTLRRHANDIGANRKGCHVDLNLVGAVLLAEDHGSGDVEDLDMVYGLFSLNGQFVANWVGIKDEVFLCILVLFHAFNELEVGDESTVARHGEGVLFRLRDDSAVFGPVHEDEVLSGNSLQRHLCAILVGAGTDDFAADSRVDSGIDSIGFGLEVGDKGVVTSDTESIAGAARDRSAVLRPVDKGVACGGCCVHGTALAISESAAARCGTAVGWAS